MTQQALYHNFPVKDMHGNNVSMTINVKETAKSWMVKYTYSIRNRIYRQPMAKTRYSKKTMNRSQLVEFMQDWAADNGIEIQAFYGGRLEEFPRTDLYGMGFVED